MFKYGVQTVRFQSMVINMESIARSQIVRECRIIGTGALEGKGAAQVLAYSEEEVHHRY